MMQEDREALFRVAHWVVGKKRIKVKTVRQLAGSEENYLVIIREIDRVRAQIGCAKMLRAEATLTLFDWLTILELFDWQCAYCQSRSFQIMSHLVPLPAGGTTPENCVPSCYGCSRTKWKSHAHALKQLQIHRARQVEATGVMASLERRSLTLQNPF